MTHTSPTPPLLARTDADTASIEDQDVPVTARPQVSVIVCAYNAQDYIAQTLDSLLSQTYRDIEILIVDDASSDDTPAICQHYATRDPRVRITRHSENRGVAHARKTGLVQAAHDLHTFIDGDDIAMPTMVERLLETLLADETLLGVSAYRLYFDDTRDLGVQKIGPTSRADYMQRYEGTKLIFLSYPNLMRRSDVMRVGGYRVDLMPNPMGIRHADFCEDLDLWCRMADLGAEGRYFLTLKEPLSKYRKPVDSLSTKNLRHMQTKMRWIKDCLRRRRAGKPERALEAFVASRGAIDRCHDWRADLGAGFYKRAGFAYARRSYPALAFYLALTGVLSPKLLLQKLKTQRVKG